MDIPRVYLLWHLCREQTGREELVGVYYTEQAAVNVCEYKRLTGSIYGPSHVQAEPVQGIPLGEVALSKEIVNEAL